MKSYKEKSNANYKKKKRPQQGLEARDGGVEVGKQNARHPILALPEFNNAPINQKCVRFVASSAIAANLTIQNCLDQFMMQVSTALGVCYIRAFRIKLLRILSPVQTQGTSVTVLVRPIAVDGGNNSFNAVPESFADTSASIDVPAFIKIKPKIDTPLGSWHFSNTTDANLVSVVAPLGSTMDIIFEYILNNEYVASTYTNTLVSGTVGTLYSRNVLGSFVPIAYTIK